MKNPYLKGNFGQAVTPSDPFQSYRGLSPDLWPRRVRQKGVEEWVERGQPPEYTGTSLFVGKGLIGRVVLITTTPVLIVRAEYAWPYIILNPYFPLASGDTIMSESIYSGTQTDDGNTQDDPINVSAYRYCHFHLNVTDVSGTWDFYAQTYDPESGAWADSQRIFDTVSSTGTSYASVGTYGIVQSLAVRWTAVSAGSITFSLSAQLKDNIVSGASIGYDRTIFIGPNNSISTESAYPILEGNEKMFIIGEGVEIWGVAFADVLIRVFEV